MEKAQVWLDTDIGGDIDDALALALILKSPEIELLGITTSFNYAEKKARIAKKMLMLAGRDDIPVYAGEDRPLGSSRELISPCQYDEDELGDIEVEGDGVRKTAEFILARKEKTILLCIGSLTHAALLLMNHPEIREKLEMILMMGGNYKDNTVESNMHEDPLAAKYVFSSGVKLVAVGTEVTDRCKLTKEETDVLRTSPDPVNRYIDRLMDRWGNYLPTLHDPLAVMYLLKPEVIKMRNEEVKVITEVGPFSGFTYNVSLRRHIWGGEAEHPNVYAAYDVDEKEMVKFFMARILS